MKLAFLAMLRSALQLKLPPLFWISQAQSENATGKEWSPGKMEEETIRSPLAAGGNAWLEFCP